MADKTALRPECRTATKVRGEAKQTRRHLFSSEVIGASGQEYRHCGEKMQNRRCVPSYRSHGQSRSTCRPNQRMSRSGKTTWFVPVLIVAALCVGALVVWRTGLLNRVGVATAMTDIRKVIANPEAYAGQTLKSKAIVDGPTVYGAPRASKAMPLFLMAERRLEDKAMRILQSIGEYQSVMIKYRIHDKSVFARIRAREQAEDRAADAERARDGDDLPPAIKIDPLDSGIPPGREASPEFRAAWEARRRQREAKSEAARQAENNDPRNYQGVLLDIWIP